MKLYLVRHGIAVDYGTPGVADHERALTPEGIRKMEEAARGLRALAIAPGAILTSPLPRAAQTARILMKALAPAGALEEVRELAPGGRRSDVYGAIVARQDLAELMLVGHQPSLGEIVARQDLAELMLVGHQPSLGEIAGDIAFPSSGAALDLKKGGPAPSRSSASSPRRAAPCSGCSRRA